MDSLRLRLVAIRELVEWRRDGRLFIAGGLSLIVMIAAVLVNVQRQVVAEGERRAAEVLDYDSWLKQGNRHPHDAAHQGMYVFKPSPPLALFDPGITPFSGASIWLQAHQQSELRFRPAQDATGLQRFGTLSVSWVLQVLGPLIVIIFGFNVFSGEREQGTLRQTLSLGVSTRTLLWGKALALHGVMVLILLPVLIATTVAVLYASVSAAALPDTALRLLLLSVGYAAYVSMMVFAVLAVSAHMPTARASLLVLLGLWFASVMLAPRFAADVAEYLDPSPSRVEFNSKMASALDAAYKRAWAKELGSEKRWGGDVPLDRWGRALQVDDHAGYAIMDQHFKRLWDTYEKQNRTQEWAGLLAPMLSLRAYSMILAGTSFYDHRLFSHAAERQRRVMQDIVSDDLVKNADAHSHAHGEQAHFTYQADARLWASVPRFSYQTPVAREAFGRSVVGFAVLLTGLALAIGAALWASAHRPE